MKYHDIESAKGSWVRLCEDEGLGLWRIAEDVRELMPFASDDELRLATLAALQPLMRAGVIRAADALAEGEFRPWAGSLNEQLARINEEWTVLGGEPTIGDIVWFIGPPLKH